MRLAILTAVEVEDRFIYRDGDLWRRFKASRKRQTIGKPNLKPVGGFNEEGWRIVKIDGGRYYVHRLIWLLHHPEWDMDLNYRNTIEHIDGDRSNNAIENLRHSTKMFHTTSRTSPGYIDVRTGKWVS